MAWWKGRRFHIVGKSEGRTQRERSKASCSRLATTESYYLGLPMLLPPTVYWIRDWINHCIHAVDRQQSSRVVW